MATAGAVAGGVIGGVLGGTLIAIAFIYVTGWAPRWVLSLEARLFRVFKKRKRWSWTAVEDGVFLGSLPRWPEHLAELRARGVRAVLSLNESWELALSPTCVREDCGMLMRQLPTPDFFAPSQRDLVEAVAFIQKNVQAGRGVYVHCNGGKGRSTVCVICWLIYAKGLSADEAFDLIRSRRKIAHMKALCGVRTQWRAIRRFEREVAHVRTEVGVALSDAVPFTPRGAPVARAAATHGKGSRVLPVETLAAATERPPPPPPPAAAASSGAEMDTAQPPPLPLNTACAGRSGSAAALPPLGHTPAAPPPQAGGRSGHSPRRASPPESASRAASSSGASCTGGAPPIATSSAPPPPGCAAAVKVSA